MKSRVSLFFERAAGPIVRLVCLGAATGLAASIEAQTATNSPPTKTYTVELKLQEAPTSIFRWSPASERLQITFKKEPPLGKSVLRSRLHFGTDTNQFIPFAWDYSARKLYLDLNRNLDLTDDPEGIFTSASGKPTQVFTNIHLNLNTPAGAHPFVVDLTLNNYNNRPSATVELRSFWQARAELQGKAWQLGIAEKPFDRHYPDTPGDWLLRPGAARQQPLSMTGAGTPDLVNYAPRLFVQTQAYKMTCRYEMHAGEPKYILLLTEEHPELGELKLVGAFLHRLILANHAGYTVVLDAPGTTARIPLGTYKDKEVWVRKQGAEAGHFSDTEITISRLRPGVLAAGGPLTNTVALAHRGRDLVLSYELKGAGGADFRLNRGDGDTRPEFAIYRGDKKVQTGKFEFG